MNKFLAEVGLALLTVAFSACATQQPANSGTATAENKRETPELPKVDTAKSVEEIRGVLAKHDKALNDKNLDTVMSTYSTDSNTVLMGTGVGERWVGPEAIKSAYSEILKDYETGTLSTNCDWRTGGVDAAGTTAWLAATCQCSDSMRGKRREYVLNVSGALEKHNGSWRFTMLHMSNVTSKSG